MRPFALRAVLLSGLWLWIAAAAEALPVTDDATVNSDTPGAIYKTVSGIRGPINRESR